MTYAQLLTALGAFVIVAFGVSLFVGYAGLDVIGALSDVMHGANTLPAIVLVELRAPRALLGTLRS